MISPCIHYRSKGGAGRGVGEIKPGSAVCRELLRQRRLFCLECDALGPPQKARPEEFDVPLVKTVAESLARAELETEKPPLEDEMNITENESIGQVIREARQARGLTVKRAAAMVGVSDNNFHVWEKGSGKPGYASALKLDEALGLELVRKYGAGLKGRPKDLEGVDDSAQNPDKSVRAAADESVVDEGNRDEVDNDVQSRPTLVREGSLTGCSNCPAVRDLAASVRRLTETLATAADDDPEGC